MGNDLISPLLRVALVTSAAVALLLLVRKPLRRQFGAALAYVAWLIVPLVAAAALLPVQARPQLLFVQAPYAVQALVQQATPAALPAQANYLAIVWAAGTLASLLWLIVAHQTFLRRAGPLTLKGAIHVSAAAVGPASVGLLRPMIVVPHDFAERYTPAEQVLIVAHERVHIARRDAIANLAAALFQCLFWFNPLVHLDARAMRQDQELACDAAVMRRHSGQRRIYAEALLKSHTGPSSIGAGIHCHWQSPHPTKERIMQLQHTTPGKVRRTAGRIVLALLAAGTFGATLSVHAGQAQAAGAYSIALFVKAGSNTEAPFRIEADAFGKRDDEFAVPRVVAETGKPFSVASEGWRAEVTVRPGTAKNNVWLATRLFKDKQLVATPTLLARHGEQATVKVGEGANAFTLAMTVTPQP